MIAKLKNVSILQCRKIFTTSVVIVSEYKVFQPSLKCLFPIKESRRGAINLMT